ncbi:hypothetical protein [Mesorhizobium sp. SARCC-RB16n]|uniref:hypothetical protein n=1 Tax=Mesorhizobium sp. SARCC-RB16n TaxID=2116687 RepID=UPI001666BC4C|nr:hypothetical protein [Mesorhizobium sp. SARCC-RB16n]
MKDWRKVVSLRMIASPLGDLAFAVEALGEFDDFSKDYRDPVDRPEFGCRLQ